MTTFEKLTNRYQLECLLKSAEGIHIGTGVPSPDSDSPFIRQSGTAFLPGSSLRGAFRSTVERILRALFPHQTCCIPFSDNDASVCDAGDRKRRKLFESATGRDLKELMPSMKLCPVCELFGSTLKAAKLKISDACQTANDPRTPVRRDGVGIDRDTETAHPQIKFDFEVLDKDVTFKCMMELENAEAPDFALLNIMLSELRSGIDVGGRKSRGLGRLLLNSYSVSYIDLDYPLELYLIEGKMKPMSPAQFEAKLRGHFSEFLQTIKEP